jgi:sugar lactone lactonase YvrE
MTSTSFNLGWLGGGDANYYMYDNQNRWSGGLTLTRSTDNGVSQKNVVWTSGLTTNRYTLIIQGRKTVGTRATSTGTTSIFRGGVTISGSTGTLTVTEIISGTINLDSYILKPVYTTSPPFSGIIKGFTSGTNGGVGVYSTMLFPAIAAGSIFTAAKADIITIYEAPIFSSIITGNAAYPHTMNGFGIEIGAVSGPTMCNIYASSDSGNIYNLVLSNQAFGSLNTDRRYLINTESVFTGTISGTTLTVTSITSGSVYINTFLNTPAGVKITGFSSGTNGGIGTYVVTPSATVSTPTTFTAKAAGVILFVTACFVDSNGVNGWRKTPALQQQLPPDTPYTPIVTFPNMVTTQNNPTISWSGGFGATCYNFSGDVTSTTVAVVGNTYSLLTFSSITSEKTLNIRAGAGPIATAVLSAILPVRILAAPSSVGLVAGTSRRPRELNLLINYTVATPGLTLIYKIYLNGVFLMNTTTPANTLITLPAGTTTAPINVRAITNTGLYEGFPSIFNSILSVPTAIVLNPISGTVSGGFVISWTGGDNAETITNSYTGATGSTPTINLAGKTATFPPSTMRSELTGTITATNAAGSTTAVTWSIPFTYGIVTFAGNVSSSGNLNSNGLSARFTMSAQSGVARDSNGNLYVTDYTNHLIRKINTSGDVSTIAGGGSTVLTNSTPQNPLNVRLANPNSIAINASNMLYFTCTGDGGVYELGTSAGATITLIAGKGTTAWTAGQFGTAMTPTSVQLSNPKGIACAPSGTNVYFVDCPGGRNNIRKLSYNTSWSMMTIAGGGNSYVNGVASGVNISPYGLAIYSPPSETESVYFADTTNNRIGKIKQNAPVTSNAFTTIAGDASSSTSSGETNSTWLSSRFTIPGSIAIDSAGNIYVRDGGIGSIRFRRLKSDGTSVSIIASDPYGSLNSGDGSPATDYQITTKYGSIAIDSNRIIYFTDGNAVRKLE